MLTLPIQSKRILGPALLVIISAVLHVFNESVLEALVYQRSLIEEVQLWRLFTANFLHTNAHHLLLNIAGIVLLWALHGDKYQPSKYLGVFSLCALGTTLGMYWFFPTINWYVGLSGALHGLFIWGAYLDIRRGYKTGWLLLIGVWLKVAYEFLIGPSEDVAKLIDANVAIEAHLSGLATGTVIVLGLCVQHLATNKKARY